VAENHTAADFRASYAGLSPDGWTPLYRALAGCSASNPACYQLASDPFAGTRGEALVIITDGDPNTGGDIDDVVNQISAMRTADPDLQVYVIGFGGGATPDNLRRMAQAGGTGDYYLATDASSLVTVLQQISALLIGCEVAIAIDGNDDASRMAVSIDNNGVAVPVSPLPPGAAATDSGWRYDGAGVITLQGQACDDLKSYATSLPPGGTIGVDVQVACLCDSSQPEVCGDLRDNDCDGKVDEGCYVPPPELPPLEICDDSLDNNGNDLVDEGCCLPAEEVCNNGDDDCDGNIDEGCGCLPSEEVCNGLDDDCDSLNDEGCEGICEPFVEACNERDDDCDDIIDEGCCEDPRSEVCDDVDNDCDGNVDEGCLQIPL